MLALWMALQLLALGLAAGRVPLSGRFPQPIERQAAAEMVVMQVCAAAYLFPSLFRDAFRWVLAVAGIWPMLKLASLLGGEPAVNVYAAATYVTVWLGTLAIWRSILRTDGERMIAVAVASLWACGGPVLLYIRTEFGGVSGLWPGDGHATVWAAVAGPVWGGLARLWTGGLLRWSDLPLGVLLGGGLLAAAIQKLKRKKGEHKLSPQLSTSGNR
jgi:hypothetical protein